MPKRLNNNAASQLLGTAIILLTAFSLSGCPNTKSGSPNDEGLTANSSVLGSSLSLKDLSDSLKTDVLAGASNTVASLSGNGGYDSAVPTMREQLRSMRSVVKIYDSKTSAGLDVPGFGGVKFGKDESSVSAYYIETKTVVAAPGDTAVYGVGYSVHYLFKKVRKGVSVTNLPYVAASVQLEGNKTQVLYSLQTYGISGQPLVRFFKPVVNKPFDVEGFAIIQSSIDGIQNILGDEALSKTVRFSPERLANVKASDLRK
ncbi:hypothetical protein HHL22_11860 [Hymenobacter sp. RP-2-7]|uniref:Lipoprotein n=1 Tax=Hymenobacter polaris TaxID=2682546 RepID=A0A7Y0AEM1_9BACT|nr:hypothetical protein [Hymenobacter polaris]NML65901.1 hypothetical protein [Hymenobacter polaris]